MLDVYSFDEDNNSYIKVSENGIQTSPIQSTHNGTTGESTTQKLFLRADDAKYYYTGILLQPVPENYVKVGSSQYPEAYINFKIIVQESVPTDDQWKNVTSGSVVTFPPVGNSVQGTTDPSPFWIQVGVPAGTPPGTLTYISLKLTRTENPVVP